jgi:hypothetical protein
MTIRPALFAAALLAGTTPLSAQWFKQPTLGVPRLADGKPNLAAPAPRTTDARPDLSGLWLPSEFTHLRNIMADVPPQDVPFQPWAAAVYESRMSKDDPAVRCLPLGIPRSLNSMFKIVQTPGVVTILYENHKRYREIFTDGRSLPIDPNPTWFGYSVGHWDGDALVVESAGFNDQSWLDFAGHPHSESLRVIERYTRKDFGHMDVQVTIDDPGAYTRPFTVVYPLAFVPDTEMLETICENEDQILPRLVGTDLAHPRTRKSVPIDPELLARYAGRYEVAQGRTITITAGRDRLLMKYPMNPDTLTMFAETPSRFFFTVRDEVIEFETDATGTPTALVIHSDVSQQRAPRK